MNKFRFTFGVLSSATAVDPRARGKTALDDARLATGVPIAGPAGSLRVDNFVWRSLRFDETLRNARSRSSRSRIRLSDAVMISVSSFAPVLDRTRVSSVRSSERRRESRRHLEIAALRLVSNDAILSCEFSSSHLTCSSSSKRECRLSSPTMSSNSVFTSGIA